MAKPLNSKALRIKRGPPFRTVQKTVPKVDPRSDVGRGNSIRDLLESGSAWKENNVVEIFESPLYQ